MAFDFFGNIKRGFGAVGESERAKLAAPGLQNERIKEFIESSKVQRLLTQARTDALESGLDISGRTRKGTVNATTQGTKLAALAEEKKALAAERKKFENKDGEVPKNIELFYNEKDTHVDNRIRDTLNPPLSEADLKGGITDRIAADLVKPPPKDRRSLFSGDDVTFGNIGPPTGISPPQPVADANDLANVTAALKPANLFQAPTPDFPESNVPLSFAEIGLTAKDDIAEFSKLEKGLPDMDLRSQYQGNQQGFAKILQALKLGKTPDGKPFTIKDAIKFIQANQ